MWATGCSFILTHYFFSLLHGILWFVQRCLILNGTEWKCCRETDFKLKWRSRSWLSSRACHHSSGQQGLLRTITGGQRNALTSYICVMMCRFPPAKCLRKGLHSIFQTLLLILQKVDIFICRSNKKQNIGRLYKQNEHNQTALQPCLLLRMMIHVGLLRHSGRSVLVHVLHLQVCGIDMKSDHLWSSCSLY